MEHENNSDLHIFSLTDKDHIRLYEQYHESLLKERLLVDYGLLLDFDTISHHGLRSINGDK